jgi:hypothetical protein
VPSTEDATTVSVLPCETEVGRDVIEGVPSGALTCTDVGLLSAVAPDEFVIRSANW